MPAANFSPPDRHLSAQVGDGLVWVYGSCEPGAEEESQAVPRVTLSKLADGSCLQLTPWFMRDLPYGHDVLCENVSHAACLTPLPDPTARLSNAQHLT